MQVMEAWDVIGNDRVVVVKVRVGSVWEFLGIVLCVVSACWERVISACQHRGIYPLVCVKQLQVGTYFTAVLGVYYPGNSCFLAKVSVAEERKGEPSVLTGTLLTK